jgi:hypothetical protein
VRRWRLAVVIVLASVLLLLATVEVGVRLFVLPHYWRPLPPFRAVMTPRQQQWLVHEHAELDGKPPDGIGVFDAELGWAYRPGSSGEGGDYTIHAGGWRGQRDYSAPPAPGIVRLAAFGESFTFCSEVPDAEAWEHGSRPSTRASRSSTSASVGTARIRRCCSPSASCRGSTRSS